MAIKITKYGVISGTKEEIQREYESRKKAEQERSEPMCFTSDEEFADFCVAPFAVTKRSGNGNLYYEGDYSDEYKKSIKEGKTFLIKDEDSQVYKRQCVCKRVPLFHEGTSTGREVAIQLSVQGLEPYYGEE